MNQYEFYWVFPRNLVSSHATSFLDHKVHWFIHKFSLPLNYIAISVIEIRKPHKTRVCRTARSLLRCYCTMPAAIFVFPIISSILSCLCTTTTQFARNESNRLYVPQLVERDRDKHMYHIVWNCIVLSRSRLSATYSCQCLAVCAATKTNPFEIQMNILKLSKFLRIFCTQMQRRMLKSSNDSQCNQTDSSAGKNERTKRKT